MDIEAIVKKHLKAWWGSPVASPEACIRAALTEADAAMAMEHNLKMLQVEANHAIELRAYEATVQNLRRELEAQRVPDGWQFVENSDDTITVTKRDASGVIVGCSVSESATNARQIPEEALWLLASDMLAAAPKKEGE